MCEFCLSHIHKIDIRQAATDEFSGGACTLFGQIYHLADNGSIVAFCIRCYATDGVFIPIDCQQLIYRILKFRYSVSNQIVDYAAVRIFVRITQIAHETSCPPMSCLVVVGYFQQQNGIFFEACEVDGIQLGEFCAIIPCVAVDAYFGKRSGILFYRICFTDDEGSDRDSFLIDGNDDGRMTHWSMLRALSAEIPM